MSNTATEIQVNLCNFSGNKPVMDGSWKLKTELAVGLISNSATY